MGCGTSKPETKDGAPMEEKQINGETGTTTTKQGAAHVKTSKPSPKAPLPTSLLQPVEFGLVKGWEAGDKKLPALLVVQVATAF